MSNELVRHGNIQDEIQNYLKKHPEWETYVSTTLKSRNEINHTEIGGFNPRNYFTIPMEAQFGVNQIRKSITL